MNFGRRAVLPLALLAVSLSPGSGPSVVAQDSRMTTVYLVLLKKGPASTAEETPATKAIQEAHRANIREMWHAQKLIVAGPLEDPDVRGVFVFKAASLEEAKSLAASDPAVKAGRLVPVVYPWWVEKGVLPEAGTYCTPPPGK